MKEYCVSPWFSICEREKFHSHLKQGPFQLPPTDNLSIAEATVYPIADGEVFRSVHRVVKVENGRDGSVREDGEPDMFQDGQ